MKNINIVFNHSENGQKLVIVNLHGMHFHYIRTDRT